MNMYINEMELNGARETLLNDTLDDLSKFFSLYSLFAKTSNSEIKRLNIKTEDKYIGACMVTEFLLYGVDDEFANYLDLDEDALKKLQNALQT